MKVAQLLRKVAIVAFGEATQTTNMADCHARDKAMLRES